MFKRDLEHVFPPALLREGSICTEFLCGQLASQLLSSTLVPGVRVLKYPLVITPAEPRPLPPSFPQNAQGY